MLSLRLASISRRTLTVVALSIAGLALTWTVGVGMLLPGWLKPRIEAEATRALGAPLLLQSLDIRPWSLAASLGGLRLGPPDKPWLQVARIDVDVSSTSLFRLAPVIERLTVTEPRLDLAREAPGRFNFQPLLDTLAKRPPPAPDAKPMRFAVNNITIERGSADVVDRISDSAHRIDAIELGIPFISTLPSHLKIDVEPRLQASVNGSPLKLDGRTQPFDDGQRSTIGIDWREIDLPFWTEAVGPLLPQPLPFALERGKLALQLQLAFERPPAPAAPRLQVTGAAALSAWRSTLTANGATLGFDELSLKGIDIEPLLRRAHVAELLLRAPAADVDVARLLAAKSRSAPSALRPAVPQPSRAPVAAESAAPWDWRVDRIAIQEGRVNLQHPAWPQGAQQLSALTLSIDGLAAAAGAAPARFEASVADARGATVRANGELRAASRQASVTTELAAFDPLPWLAPWRPQLPVELLEGRLNAGARFSVNGEAGRTELREGRLELLNLRLQPRGARAPDADRLLLPRLLLSGVEADIAPAQPPALRAERLDLERLDIMAARDQGGTLGWIKSRAAQAGDSTPTSTPAADPPLSPPPSASPSPSPSLRLTALTCSACAFTLTDRAVTPPATLALDRIALKLGNLSNDRAERASFEFSTTAQKNGRIEFNGQIRPQPLELRSKLKLDSIDLRLLQPYLEKFLSIGLSSARASVAGELNIDGNESAAVSALRWRGQASLAEVLTLDQLNDRAEFVRAKRISADGLDIDWTPALLRADLGRVALDDFSARVIINANGTINLREVTRAEADRSAASTAPNGETVAPPAVTQAVSAASAPAAASAVALPADAASAAPTASPRARPQLRWRAIEIKRGRIDFTDNLIRPNYSAQLSDLAGTISGVAWNEPQPAQVDLTAKVDGSAPLTINGTLHPLGAQLATDIRAEARGVELTRLSTYSERYAGYGIEKGTLSVKLRYKIENGKLEAENNVYLDQLTFGDKVESPNALKLPVLLAVALLRDSNGVIDINLPVSGTLDDPQFSIGGIIIKVIVNLITKAVTAPFSLLASAFGGGGEELGYVLFAPGSDTLDDAGIKRLDTLAKALNARPGLKLEATGRADPGVDEAALRERYLDQLMRTQKARASGQLAESVKIDAAEREQWLTAAYKAADFKGKPRNVVGLQKSLPAAEMEALLRANAPVGPEALKTLADDRANHVKAHLADKVPAERLLLTASKIGTEGIDDKSGAARVSFALK